ncbi:cyclase family protein [Simkania sp.]|uniref:cyclase family protein n=1 Tax=Simkania sp. TaxID=34094 RepID=UPI003B522254
MPVWPGDPQPQFIQKMHLEKGDIATVTYINMGAHTGTHVDAPCHFIKGGEGVETLELETLAGPALVIEALNLPLITKEVLEEHAIPEGTERLLIKTDNSESWAKGMSEFDESYVAISEDGAKFLVEKGVKLVGVDGFSIAPFDAVVPTHEIILGARVVVIEGLNLAEISAGTYTLCCLPIKIAGSDGAPARTILMK